MYLGEIGTILAKNKYEILQKSSSFCIFGRREPGQDKFIIVVNNYGELFRTRYDIENLKKTIAGCSFYMDSKIQQYLFVLRQEKVNRKDRISGGNGILYFADDGYIKCVKCRECFKNEITQIAERGKEEHYKAKLLAANSPWSGTKTPIMTILFCLLCIGVYMAGYDLQEFGISSKNLFQNNKWNTLVTYMFLHENLLHLTGNMISMMIWGSCLERKIGSEKFLILCMISGVYGGFISSIYKIVNGTPEIVTVGLSGVVYAIMGTYIVYQIRNKNPYGLALAYVLISLMLGFLQTGTDNVVHVIGLVFGVYCMAIFYLLHEIYRHYFLRKSAENKR